MGNSITDIKVLLIGLDNCGKTTILQKIITPNYTDHDVTPTIGFKSRRFNKNDLSLQFIDMSGQAKCRGLWLTNATNTSSQDKIRGIMFVIDSTNKMRINVARSQLEIILENQEIPKHLPFLFFSNKIDQKQSLPVNQVQQIMQLKTIGRNYRICPCSGITGVGVEQGMKWLCDQIKILIQKNL